MLENFLFFIDLINVNFKNNFFTFFLLYFFSLIIFFTCSLPGGSILVLLSGFFFGIYIGFLINIVSVILGSFFFVTFAQSFFGKFFNNFYLKFSLKFSNLIKDSSYEYLIIFRLIQGNPLFIQNLCLSFLNISKMKFLITSFIGLSPAIIIFTYFGSKLYQIHEIKNIDYSDIISKDFIFFIIVFILILILRIFYKKRISKKILNKDS